MKLQLYLLMNIKPSSICYLAILSFIFHMSTCSSSIYLVFPSLLGVISYSSDLYVKIFLLSKVEEYEEQLEIIARPLSSREFCS